VSLSNLQFAKLSRKATLVAIGNQTSRHPDRYVMLLISNKTFIGTFLTD